MTRADVNRASFVFPLLFSALAAVVVLSNIFAGVQPQPDENASAHIWQLLMIAQLPLMALFGIVGAFIGSWFLPKLGIHLGAGVISAIANATIGAILLLLVVRLLGGGYGRGRRL